MKCISTLRNLFALTLTLQTGVVATAQNTYVSTGGNTSYSLAAGDSLYIESGVYTGSITKFNEGAKITVAEGASFQPSSISNPRGTIKVLGTFKPSFSLSSNGGFAVINYGISWFTQSVSMNQGPQTWTNNFGGTFRFDQGVSMNGTTFVNSGTFISSGKVTVNNSSTFSNNNEFTVTHELALNNSIFNNAGKLNTNSLNLSGNTTTLNNTCRVAVNGIVTNYARIYNSGLLWSTSANNNSKIDNGGGSTFTNAPNGIVKSVNFTNNGTMNGSGYWYFTGTTINYGTVAASGDPGSTLKIFDATRTQADKIFDNQYGNVAATAQFTAQSAPDTITLQSSCASQARNITLPVKWQYFHVSLFNNIPTLSWAAEQQAGTVFQIQRSYDGINFTTIGNTGSEIITSAYKFEDHEVNPSAKAVYYRICAVENSGSVTLSETRSLTMVAKTGLSLQAVPNPFISQLNISYQSGTTEKVIVRIMNMSGTMVTAKTVNVGRGFNSITITEAASLSKGIYLIQLISDNQLIAIERVIKQ